MFNVAEAEAELERALQGFYSQSLGYVHEVAQDALGIAFEIDDPVTRAFLADAGQQIGNITANTLRMVRRELEAGQAAGEGIDQLARRLRESAAFSPGRARTIARTELGHASNTAAVYTYRASNLVESILVFDGEQHPFCAEWNGKVIPLDQMGSVPTLAHPNCVRAFGPMVKAADLPKPEPKGPYADVLSQIGNKDSDALKLSQSVGAGIGEDIQSYFIDDPAVDIRGTLGYFKWHTRQLGLGRQVYDGVQLAAKEGMENPKAYDGMKTLVHEAIHSTSPLGKNFAGWWRGKPVPFMYFLEEGITETRARKITGDIAEASGVPKELVDRARLRGTYPAEVSAIRYLEEKKPGISDEIWKKTSPHERTNVAADALKPFVRERLTELGAEKVQVDALLKKAGNSVWGIAAQLQYRILLEDATTLDQAISTIENRIDYFKVARVNKPRGR